MQQRIPRKYPPYVHKLARVIQASAEAAQELAALPHHTLEERKRDPLRVVARATHDALSIDQFLGQLFQEDRRLLVTMRRLGTGPLPDTDEEVRRWLIDCWRSWFKVGWRQSGGARFAEELALLREARSRACSRDSLLSKMFEVAVMEAFKPDSAALWDRRPIGNGRVWVKRADGRQAKRAAILLETDYEFAESARRWVMRRVTLELRKFIQGMVPDPAPTFAVHAGNERDPVDMAALREEKLLPENLLAMLKRASQPIATPSERGLAAAMDYLSAIQPGRKRPDHDGDTMKRLANEWRVSARSVSRWVTRVCQVLQERRNKHDK